MAMTVMAITPQVSSFVNILDTRSYQNKPTVEQLVQLNKLWEIELDQPYIVVTATTDFAESLQKDMPNGEITLPLRAGLVCPSSQTEPEQQLMLPWSVEA